MLVLSRHVSESIIVGDDIVITVVSIRGDQVRIGISAPTSTSVHREEVYREVRREERAGWGQTTAERELERRRREEYRRWDADDDESTRGNI